MKSSSTRKGIFLALFIILLAYLFVHYEFYFLIMEPKRAIEFVNSFHPYDDFVFIFFEIFQVLIAGAVPGEISEFVGGYIYGTVLGTI